MKALSILVCVVAVLAKEKSAKSADCSASEGQVTKLKAEVESLKAELAKLKADAAQATCSSEFSISDALSKTSDLASEMVQSALDQTSVDEQVVDFASTQFKTAGAFGAQIVDQVSAHPCASDLTACHKTITSHELYKTHLAAHVDTVSKAAEPHLATVRPHVDTALQHASAAYDSAKQYASLAQTHGGVAYGHVSSIAEKAPEHLETVANAVLDPAFNAVKKVSPKNHKILPKKPLDRLLLISLVLFLIYNFWFIVRLGLKVLKLATKILLFFGIKVPFKVTTTTLSWSFFFGTGFYVCGLCRSRKKAVEKTNGKADAKSKPKSVKPATEKELVDMLNKTKEKGKLMDGASKLCQHARSGKPLTSPEEMKDKEVKKDVLKKALDKFKELDRKKLAM